MVVITSVDITRAAAAWRLLRLLATGLLALGILAAHAAASTSASGAARAASGLVEVAEPVQLPPLGVPKSAGLPSPGMDMDEPGEDPFKPGRMLKAPPPAQPAGAPLRPADLRHDGTAASLPERPPRA